MCGRYAIFTEEENEEIREIINGINERYKQEAPKVSNDGLNSKVSNVIDIMKTGEIFPTNTVPVITSGAENRKIANLFNWGFPNYRQPNGLIINARSETLHEKPTFRKLLHTGRCLVPASGFYEWNKISDKKKEKYLIQASGSRLMYFAGLYNNFIDKNGTSTTGFVIITAQANEQMSQIHSRMPVILNNNESTAWIASGDSEFARLLLPYRSQLTLSKVDKEDFVQMELF